MSTLLLSLIFKAGPFLIGGAGVLLALWKARQSGVKAERAKQAAEELKARDIADEIDGAIAGRSPASNRDELKKWAKR